jgi:hypothetical protein
MSLYSNLQGQTVYVGCSELAGRRLSVCKIDGLGGLFGSCKLWQLLDILNLARKDSILLFYVFFWVVPRRLSFICRRFGTLCLFHLHRQVGMKNN